MKFGHYPLMPIQLESRVKFCSPTFLVSLKQLNYIGTCFEGIFSNLDQVHATASDVVCAIAFSVAATKKCLFHFSIFLVILDFARGPHLP